MDGHLSIYVLIVTQKYMAVVQKLISSVESKNHHRAIHKGHTSKYQKTLALILSENAANLSYILAKRGTIHNYCKDSEITIKIA